MIGDEVGRANLGLDDHRARTGQAEIVARRTLGDDDRAEQLGLAGDIAQDTDDQVEMIADGDCRKLLEPYNAEPASGVRAENRDPVRPLGMAQIRQTSGLQLGSDRSEQPGRRGVHRKLESGLVQRVLHGRRADQRIRRHPPRSSFRRRPRRSDGEDESAHPRESLCGSTMPVVLPRPRRDKKLGRGKLVELADDAVAGGAGQAERRHEGRQPDDDAQHGQHHAPWPGEHSRKRFVQEITDRDS